MVSWRRRGHHVQHAQGATRVRPTPRGVASGAARVGEPRAFPSRDERWRGRRRRSCRARRSAQDGRAGARTRARSCPTGRAAAGSRRSAAYPHRAYSRWASAKRLSDHSSTCWTATGPRRVPLDQLDQVAPQPATAVGRGDVEPLELGAVLAAGRDAHARDDAAVVVGDHPPPSAGGSQSGGELGQVGVHAGQVQHAAGVLGVHRADEVDDRLGVVVAQVADLQAVERGHRWAPVRGARRRATLHRDP